MEEKLTKELAKKLMAIKGEVRGLALKYDGEYISQEKGERGLARLEKELERLGCPIKYKEIRATSFFPIGLRAISLLAMKEVFDWDDDKIKMVGAFHPGVPTNIRLFVKYLYSPLRALKSTQRMWEKYYTIGKITFVKYDKERKYALFELRNFDIHPIVCRVVEGHIAFLVKIALNFPEVTCKEIKCSFEDKKPGSGHEFIIQWK